MAFEDYSIVLLGRNFVAFCRNYICILLPMTVLFIAMHLQSDMIKFCEILCYIRSHPRGCRDAEEDGNAAPVVVDRRRHSGSTRSFLI